MTVDPKEAQRVLGMLKRSPWIDYQEFGSDDAVCLSSSDRALLLDALKQAAREPDCWLVVHKGDGFGLVLKDGALAIDAHSEQFACYRVKP